MSLVFRRLWAGEVPLAQAFWTYAVLYGLLANLLTTAVALTLFALDMPIALALLIYFLPLPYNLFVLVSVWRSAERFEGPRRWADLARAAVIAWVLTLTVI